MRTRRILWPVGVFIGAALVFSPLVSAAEKQVSNPCFPGLEMEKKTDTKAQEKKAKSAAGEVVSVDAKKGMLTIKAKDKEMSFSAESKTAKSALEKVKAGDKVTVSYAEKDGKMTAQSVAKAKTTK